MAATPQPVNVYTDEKARRLVRTFFSSLAFSFLLCWFEIVILRPAGELAKEMVGFVLVAFCVGTGARLLFLVLCRRERDSLITVCPILGTKSSILICSFTFSWPRRII